MDRGLVSAGTLYVVATPLGNLEDLSERAKRVLREAPVVAAEDTRRARILLDHVGAHPTVVSYHAHSPSARLGALLRRLAEGENVVLLTDAGTPTVSDPGVALVRRAQEIGVTPVAVPGPSAVTAALSISGLSADRYSFLGFPPRKGAARQRLLEAVAVSPWTVVLFDAPSRLVRLLEDLMDVCGAERDAAVARELTKVHEELKSGTLSELAVYYRRSPPRGEVTVLVAGREPTREPADEDALRDRAAALLARGMSRRDVAAHLATEFDCSRNEAYRVVARL
jgi:16S rRNA (cytidine1402-2'-O)-methyltransferase